MLTEMARRRTVAGCDIWIARAASPDADRPTLMALALAELGLEPQGLRTECPCLGRTSLGRPVPLAADGRRLGFGVSFSHLHGQLWAAVSAAPGLGLDAACAAEFAPPYPEQRVFAPQERQAVLVLCSGRLDALSLLWSLKEAAAKALGTGFHRVEPIELTAAAFQPTPQGLACEVRAPAMTLPAFAERLPGGWLSIAVAGGLAP